jgi:serine/threonine-protein kinase ATR
MLRNMDDEDVEDMLESTFTTVIQRWTTFDDPTRIKAETALQYLLKERSRLVRNKLVNLPSLSLIPELEDVERKVQALRSKTDEANTFAIFSRRISHENSGVVSQALTELKGYLPDHQEFLQSSAASEQPDVVVSQLVRSVLDSCIRFNGPSEKIPVLAAECLGLVGCLDPNRVESIRVPRNMVVVHNFEDALETTDFVLFALEEAILPAFLSTPDSLLQGFLSYAMQHLLQSTDFAEIIPKATKNPSGSQHSVIFQKWLALPHNVREQLTPFLTSRYGLTEIAQTEYKYPIFQPEKPCLNLFSTWLRNFVLSLLKKQNSKNASIIFPSLMRAVRPKETSIASFLLPYIVLYVMIVGSDQDRQDIGRDLINILRYEPPAKLREEVKLCVEVRS